MTIGNPLSMGFKETNPRRMGICSAKIMELIPKDTGINGMMIRDPRSESWASSLVKQRRASGKSSN
jgi:hypothetical protein